MSFLQDMIDPVVPLLAKHDDPWSKERAEVIYESSPYHVRWSPGPARFHYLHTSGRPLDHLNEEDAWVLRRLIDESWPARHPYYVQARHPYYIQAHDLERLSGLKMYSTGELPKETLS